MKNYLNLFLFLVLLIHMSSCNVFLINGKISKSKVGWKIDKSSNRKYFRTQIKLAKGTDTNEPQPIDIAKAYLGKIFPLDQSNPDAMPCDPNNIDLFKDKIDQLPLDISFVYTYSLESNFDVNANINADFNTIVNSNPILTDKNKQDVKAKLTAAYSKYKKNGLQVQGHVFIYSLKPGAMLNFDNTFSKCLKSIKTKNDEVNKQSNSSQWDIIRQIGFIHYDFQYTDHSLDQIENQLVADLSDVVGTANITLSFKSSAQKDYQSSLKNGYQIIFWDYIDYDWLKKNELNNLKINNIQLKTFSK